MKDEARHHRVKEALYEAQGLAGEAREALLRRLDAENAELAAEVRSLLAEKTRVDASGRGVTAAAAEMLRQAGVTTTTSGGRVRELGPYRLLEVIGTGGMGVVYRAEQREPIRREVAVKLLVGGISVGRIAERFAAEQRALALMDHPGIARILDAGGDETGTPYLVMELVRGVAITEYCREKRLTQPTVLALFVSVCRAVQHAHQKGIIHRDLKPANILIAEVDGRPAVKIIDFGIARIVETDGGPARGTHLTGEGQVLGTLEYMSPEQATGRVREIDTRTDVYSLGAILYELLTGSMPHDLRELSLTEAIRVIANDAPRPFRQTRAEGRRPDGDLEIIVRKALETEPARRYESAGALADDIGRYLRAEPIVARPPSALYQLKTTMRRHRAAVLVGGAIFLGLVVFGVSMSILYAGQMREREHAEAEAAKAKAINGFLTEAFAAASPDDMGHGVTALQVLYRAIGRVDASFRNQPDVRASLEETFGQTLLGLGEPARAESILTVALAERLRIHADDHPDVFASRMALGAVTEELSRFRQADSIAADALARRGRGATSAEWIDALRMRGRNAQFIDPGLADSLTRSAYDLAVKTLNRSDPLLGELLYERASVAMAREQFSKADSLFREAIAHLTKTRGEFHPATLSAFNSHAMNIASLVSIDSALVLQQKNLARFVRVYGPDHVRVADARNNLATAFLMIDRVEEAARLFRQAVETWERQYGTVHGKVAVGYHNVGYALQCRGRFVEAKRWYRKELESVTASGDPDNLGCLLNMTSVALDLGDATEAMRWARRAVEVTKQTELHVQRGSALCGLAEVHLDAGRPDSAFACVERALVEWDLGRQLYDLNTTRAILALALARRGQLAKADSILSVIKGPLVNGKVDWIVDKRRAYKRLISHYRTLGRPEEIAYYRAALDRLPH